MKTINPTRPEIEERLARFATLEPMSTMRDNPRVTQAARDIIFARKIMPVVLERTESPFGNQAPVYGAAGMTMFISVCPPGQGPCLHAHVKTFETFTVLEGKFEFYVGDRGQETIVLEKWDSFSCPPGWCRGFRNVHTADSVLQTVITGGVHDRNDIGLPPVVAEQLEAVDPGVVEEFRKIGLSFEAGMENTAPARV
jgi:quercetin dioxygenase-like cupin family protein